jgi:Tol biopolymer transport system component/DNA-binding winged helix-turn-helix (wHTH) protein
MYRFGAFRVDPRAHELRRDRIRIKIQEQSFIVLLKLLVRPGELVAREELRAALWPADTFVDFDTGLNTVIKRLREALRDSAEGSQFIETVPKLGYRFIAPVEVLDSQPPKDLPTKKSGRLPGWLKWAAPTAVVLAGSAITLIYLSRADRHIGATVEVVPLSGRSEMEDNPAFSPDGNQVAYTSSGAVPDGTEGLYTAMIGGENPLRLTSNPNDCCPAWSPDARSVAYARGDPGGRAIYAVPALGGTPRQLYSEEGRFKEHIGYLPRFSWSPDGKYLAVSALFTEDKRPSISLVWLADSSRVRLTWPAPQYSDWSPSFSPDGKSIVFLRSSGPGMIDDLYVIPATGGEPRRLTSDKALMKGSFAWTPDSREIIFCSYRGGMESLWRISAGGGTPSRVEGAGARSSEPAIAPVGNRLAYASEVLKVDLWKVRLSDARHAAGPGQMILPSNGFIGIASFSPDGKKLAYESTQTGYSEIWTADSDGSHPTQLTFLNGLAGTPRWSNDARSVAFDYRPDQRSEIYRMDVAQGHPRLVPTIPGADNVTPSWSRDGQWIYFSSNPGNAPDQVWKVPDAGGPPIQVTRNGGTWPLEGADGFVYYSKSFHSDEIWKTRPDGGEETLVVKAPELDTWSWDLGPDGIYFVTNNHGGKGTVFLYEFQTKRILSLMPLEKRAVEPAISRDGKSFVFFQIDQYERTIMLVNHFH